MKGPYVQMGLPFATGHAGQGVLREFRNGAPGLQTSGAGVAAAFQPAARRRSTLVATGTGSGKTECFLYPCSTTARAHAPPARRGIKALVIYPMNALATDQARRFAETHREDARLQRPARRSLSSAAAPASRARAW